MIGSPTEKKLIDAFIDLYTRKEYSKISVQEVCTLAHVSKTTFYYYYENLDALKLHIEAFIYESASDIFKHWEYLNLNLVDNNDPFPQNLEAMRFVYKYQKIFAALFGEFGDKSFINRYQKMIYDKQISKLNFISSDTLRNEYYASILVAIIFASSTQIWKSPNTKTVEDMANAQSKLTLSIISMIK